MRVKIDYFLYQWFGQFFRVGYRFMNLSEVLLYDICVLFLFIFLLTAWGCTTQTQVVTQDVDVTVQNTDSSSSKQNRGLITGVIKDSSDAALLQDVVIKIGNKTAFSDQTGAYQLKDVPIGEQTITFNKEWYEVVTDKITVESSAVIKDINLVRKAGSISSVSSASQTTAPASTAKPIVEPTPTSEPTINSIAKPTQWQTILFQDGFENGTDKWFIADTVNKASRTNAFEGSQSLEFGTGSLSTISNKDKIDASGFNTVKLEFYVLGFGKGLQVRVGANNHLDKTSFNYLEWEKISVDITSSVTKATLFYIKAFGGTYIDGVKVIGSN